MKALLAIFLLCACAAQGQQPASLYGKSAGASDAPHAALFGATAEATVRAERAPSGFERTELFGESAPAGKKSPALAIAYSLLLPGMGELYAGDYGTGKYLTMLDGGLIVALISVDRYANWLRDDSRQYAVTHSGATMGGKSDQFFADIGDFENVYDYNEQVLRDRDPQKVYDPNAGYFWSWDTPADREQYREIRVNSENRFNDTRFIVAAIAVNHLVSAINAARLVIRHNKEVEEGGMIDLHADVIGGIAHPSGVRVTLSRTF